MKTETLSYDVAGSTYLGYLADGGGRNGVLICHEGNGLGPQVKDRAHALAELGYVAFCVDYVGGGAVLPDMPSMMAKLGALRGNPEHVRVLARAGLAQLAPRVDRVAATGYCFGGTFALELARDGADLAAVVAFHAGLATTRPGPIQAKVLACIGADDPDVPPAERAAFEAEMRAAGGDWRLYLYGGAVHGFANPLADAMNNPAVRYHPASHRRSWAEMLALFDEVF
ncbi:MAG: dienelactone hydrolase family protein [Kofleriaceae bacterium]